MNYTRIFSSRYKIKCMKKILWLLLAMPFCNYAQTVNEIYVGLNYSHGQGYRQLDSEPGMSLLKENRDLYEDSRSNFSLGVSVIVPKAHRLSVETGLYFSKKGYDHFQEFKSSDLQFSSTTRSKKSFNYFEIPVKVNRYFLDGKFKLYASAGMAINVLLNEKTKTESVMYDGSVYESESDRTPDYRSVNAMLQLGIGAQYELNDSFFVTLEPLYKRSLNSVIDEPIKEYLSFFGCNAGIHYRL